MHSVPTNLCARRHPDGNYEDGPCFALKLAFYLDELTAQTGCVRLIPGSHKESSPWRANPNAMALTQELGLEPHEIPGQIAVETSPGDLVVFNHKTFHAAYGGGTRRRMFTVCPHLPPRCPRIAVADGLLVRR